ncbi:MAG: DUF4442 domain-containing protein [Deltaproteobacteria bacterium]|nr:DUF4442 domain-containing protein [Deltaproteobacteria bacterium]
MPESLKSKLFRYRFNFWPCYWGTGAKITYIASDFREMRVRLPLTWRTKNYVGTLYGGSIYASVDPQYMLMLIQILGPEYIIWDKSAQVEFLKPGKNFLEACLLISEEEIQTIKRLLKTERSIDRNYPIDLIDKEGRLCARVTKTIYIRKK